MGGSKGDEHSLAGPDDRSPMIIKGKRTKRQRTPSPHCGEGTTTASSSSMAACGGGGDYDSSPSSSSGMTVLGSTEEEEDLAYCLILLAQGPRRQTGDNVDAELGSGEYFRSNKRFPEVSVTVGAATRAVSYVFECKTCCRTFPSFQALGGHRASHKKPRAAEDTKKPPSEPSSDTDEEVRQFRKITISPPAIPVPNLQNPIKPLQASKPKIHECSICRSEFSSGQALGGHMRRHRAAAAPPTSSGHVASSVVGEDTSRGAILSLDLNLPAPEDDRKFQLAAAPAQKPILFSAPALVDCHY